VPVHYGGLVKREASYFVFVRAEPMAQKLQMTEEKALRAIIQSEASRQTYKKIQDIFGTQQSPLTQVDVIDKSSHPSHPHTTLTC